MKLRDKISTNRYVGDINTCKDLQNEASFYISLDFTNPHLSRFKSRINEIYAGNKYKVDLFFKAFAGQISPSVEVTETIFSQVFRVWDSGDPVNEVNFRNKDLYDEALSFIEKFNQWWLDEYWEAFKYQFCSFIVVDLPVQQIGFRPDPYPFVLDIEYVLYIEKTRENNVKEIIFQSFELAENDLGEKIEKEFWYWYTDSFYSKYLIDGDNEILQFVAPHNLKRCPVHKVWNEKLNNTSWLLTKGLITPQYEDLFWYNVKTIESRKADLYYLNPIRQMPKLSCGYTSNKDPENRYKTKFGEVKCSGGWLYTLDGKIPVIENEIPVLCPVCGRSRHASAGVGNEILIDLDSQAIKDGKVSIDRELVKYITPDIQGTKEQYNRVTELKDSIIKHCVGSDDQPTKSAVNELQQQAIFESKESVLKRLSEGISNVITAVEKDMFELRYPDAFISNRYNQGTKFYLYEVEDLLNMYGKAKDPIQKRQINEQIIEVKYRNNQKKLNEEKLLYKILPYNTMTDEEFMSKIGGDAENPGLIINKEAIELRLQFSNAIEMFESEFGSIIEFFTYKFPENTPEKRRIEIIRSFLIQNIKTNNNVQIKVS